MHSGCPHSKGGAFLLSSSMEVSVVNNITPEPMVCLANGMKNPMAAASCTTASSQVEWQGGFAHSQQDVPDALHQQEAQVATASTGFSETFMLQQGSSVPQRDQHRSCPLLTAFQAGQSLPDSKSWITTLSPSDKAHTIIPLNASAPLSHERLSKIWENMLAALNCGKTGTQIQYHSGGPHSTPLKQQVSSSQLLSGLGFPGAEAGPLLDEQIHNVIAKKVAYYRRVLSENNSVVSCGECENPNAETCFCSNGRIVSLQTVRVRPESNRVKSTLPASGNSVERQSQAIEEEGSVVVDCTASKNQSTEYPQLLEVAAICTKKEYENPVVVSTSSGMALKKLTEKNPSLMINCSSLQKGFVSVCLEKDLEEIDQESVASSDLSLIQEKNKGDTWLTHTEGVGRDTGTVIVQHPQSKTSPTEVHYVNTDAHKNIDQQLDCVTCEEVIARCTSNSSNETFPDPNAVLVPTNQTDQLSTQRICEGAVEEAGPAYTRSSLDILRMKEDSPLERWEGESALPLNLKAPQYEDISDVEDVPPWALKLPTQCEEPQYEDISEDENSQTENTALEMPSIAVLPEPNNKPSRCEEVLRLGQAQIPTETTSDEGGILARKRSQKPGTNDVAQHCGCLCLVETNDVFHGQLCPLCDSKAYIEKDGDHMDNCSVIPISISSLRYEPADEYQGSPEEVLFEDEEARESERPGASSPNLELEPQPVVAPTSFTLEVFDTLQSFQNAKSVQCDDLFVVASGMSTPECEVNSEEEPYLPQSRSRSSSKTEDSCETEDSCNYSPASEHNLLTVSRKMLMSTSLTSENDDDDPVCGKRDNVPNVQISPMSSCIKKLKQLLKHKTVSKPMQPKIIDRSPSKQETNNIIIISDSEDESNQTYKNGARRRLTSLGSANTGDTPSVSEDSPENVVSQCGPFEGTLQVNKPSSASSPSQEHQPEGHESHFNNLMEDARSYQSQSRESTWQLVEDDSDSETVQPKIGRKKIRSLDSDSGDGIEQNRKKAKRQRLSYTGNTAFVQQKRLSLENVDIQCQTAVFVAGSSVQPKSGQEAKVGSKHNQHKTIWSTSSKGRVTANSDKVVKLDNISKKREKRISSESEDSSDPPDRPTETLHPLNGATSKKRQPNRSGDVVEKHLQSVVKEAADCSLVSHPVLNIKARKQSSLPKFLKFSHNSTVRREDVDETEVPKAPTETSDIDELTLHRNERGRFVSKPKPANKSLSEGQTNKKSLKIVSKQHLQPSQEDQSNSMCSYPTSGHLSEARQSLGSLRGSSQCGTMSISSTPHTCKHKQSPSISRCLSSAKVPSSQSRGNPSKLPNPYVSSKTPSLSSTKTQLIKDWCNSYVPTRRDRKNSSGMEKDSRTPNCDAQRETRPGQRQCKKPPRQRQNSHESQTPLMKRAMSEAKQRTRDQNREAPKEQSYSVGEGYKWSEKQSTKGGRRGNT